MSRSPVCSGANAVKALEKAGWIKDRESGNPVSLKKAGDVFDSPHSQRTGAGNVEKADS
jgi:hypothetical protein